MNTTQTETLGSSATWLVDQWIDKLLAVVEGMTEERPKTAWRMEGDDALGDGALLLEQRFAQTPDPLIWIGVPESVCLDLGGRVLATAGLKSAGNEEKRSTCLEMIEQSLSGLAGMLSQRLSREMRREPTAAVAFFPNGLPVIRVTLSFGALQPDPIWIAFAPALMSRLEELPTAETAAEQPRASEPENGSDSIFGASRTFELLLDVALPVSISFGKAEMPVKDVLKLTTGSIVELNRSVNEPVDIIVNGCTIARGEVVVVEGNYGVRVNSIISRRERLRTGGAAVAEARGR